MKTLKTLFIILALGIATTTTAQEKSFSYTAYYSYGTASSSCLDIKKAYISPIVSHTFEYISEDHTYVDSRDYDSKTHDLKRKWTTKCKAQFDIKGYCFGHGPDNWYKSRSEADEERDEEIADLKRQGYSVYDNFSFGFYID